MKRARYTQLRTTPPYVECLSCFGVLCNQQTLNTPRTVALNLPIHINPDGTALVIELVRIDAQWDSFDAQPVAHTIQTQIASLQLGRATTLLPMDSERVIWQQSRILQGILPANASYCVQYDRTENYDLTDKAGRGFIVVVPDITVYYDTDAFPTNVKGIRMKIWYKQIEIDTALYTMLREKQNQAL